MPRIKLETLMHIGTEIEDTVNTLGIDYIEACILYCEEHDMEIETLGSIIKKHQKVTARIQAEAESLHYLEKDDSKRLEFEGE